MITEVLIVGDIPDGITSVRAAYERATVTITIGHDHLGGMLANGMSIFATLHPRTRIPLVGAFCEEFCEHYTQDPQSRFDAVSRL